MLTATAYLGAVGLGVTSPRLFCADDGRVYVVKLQNNRLGAKVLVNEWLACRFAAIMELCFPPGGLITVSEQTVMASRRMRTARVKPGTHFASRFLTHSRYLNDGNIYKAVNKRQMAGVILFDHIFHNFDRVWNRRNLLLRREEAGYVIYAIDNSHLFGRGNWTIDHLNQLAPKIVINYRRAYGWVLKYFLKPEDFDPYREKVAALTEADLTELVDSIPAEWLPDKTERQALTDFMVARRDLSGTIVDRLCSLIP